MPKLVPMWMGILFTVLVSSSEDAWIVSKFGNQGTIQYKSGESGSKAAEALIHCKNFEVVSDGLVQFAPKPECSPDAQAQMLPGLAATVRWSCMNESKAASETRELKYKCSDSKNK